MSGSPYIVPLRSSDACLDRVGGKAKNLAELVRWGYPVPSGFTVSTEAYGEFLASNGLDGRILQLAGSVLPEDPASLEAASAEIGGLFAEGRMPQPIADAIVAAYCELAAGSEDGGATARRVDGRLPVAVRSSATAEDLPDVSFAGQQETLLNVVGSESVCRAVQECWSSLWTARAMGYRARNRFAPNEVAIAVIVQLLVPAEVSGVVFTANPLSGHRGEIVVDASFGLGEAIVSGRVQPDHYVVRAGSWEITSRFLGSKAISVVALPGGETRTVERQDDGRQALADEQIRTLAQLAAEVAGVFGSPQDIEWAWADGRLHLLQARPITALYPLPPPAEGGADGLRIYLNFSAIQGVMEPMTPLGRAAVRVLVRGFQRQGAPELVAEAGGRVFCDVTGLARNPRLRRTLLGAMQRVDPGARQALVRLIEEGRLAQPAAYAAAARRRRGPFGRARARLAVMRAIFSARHLVRRAVAALLRPAPARRRAVARAEAFLARVEERAAGTPDLARLLAAFEADLGATPAGVYGHLVPLIVPAMILMSAVDRWLVRWLGLEPGAGLELMRGLPGNVTVEMDLALWEVAEEIRSVPPMRRRMLDRTAEELADDYRRRELPPPFLALLDRFLESYGMRGVAEIDLGRSRWRDDPSHILDILRGYLELDDAALAPAAALANGMAEAERLRGEYVQRLRRTRRGWLRARLFDAAVERMRLLGGLRELPKLHFCKILGVYRSLLRRQGRELEGAGILDSADDVFFVPLDQLRRFAAGEPVDLRAAVAAERADYRREAARRRPPRLLLSTGEAFYEGLSEGDDGDLVGAGVSPGVVEGKVKIVLQPQGVRLDSGDILVCPSTDPCWTPLFVTAGGLVMEMGGLTTHGAVVAREYGIPAVVGVHHATELLKSGERVRVDGSAGRVARIS